MPPTRRIVVSFGCSEELLWRRPFPQMGDRDAALCVDISPCQHSAEGAIPPTVAFRPATMPRSQPYGWRGSKGPCRTGGKPVKARRQKAAPPKRRNGPKAVRRRRPEDPLLLFSVLCGSWAEKLGAVNGDAVRELAMQFLALAEKRGTTAETAATAPSRNRRTTQQQEKHTFRVALQLAQLSVWSRWKLNNL